MEVFGGKSEQNPTKPGEETTKPQEPETSGTNVAVGKTVVQSGAEVDAMGADKAIDGNKVQDGHQTLMMMHGCILILKKKHLLIKY